jgi:N-acetylglucosaminyldiphosphoundecaprenol N-acetyl-beta-D-mannosaminyltransferase
MTGYINQRLYKTNTLMPETLATISSALATGKPAVPVLGGRIAPLNLDKTVVSLLEMVTQKSRSYVCVANVHTATLALRDDEFKNALNGASLVVADGMPLVWRVRAAGYPQAGRVYGADLVEAMSAAGVGAGIRHGFFGGFEGVAETMATRLKERYPDMQIAGTWNPGMIRMGETLPAHLIDAINAARCDIVWVGLGAPKQELWMAQHLRHLRAPVLVGVGQAFDILAGRTTRAPDWMASRGLEWLYRVTHDPRRLWKRYFVYNSLFLWYLLRERLGKASQLL